MTSCGRSTEPTGDEAGTHPARRAAVRTSRGASPGRQGGRLTHSPPQDREVKSRQRPRRPNPHPPALRPVFQTRPSRAMGLRPWTRRTWKPEAPACCSLASALAGGNSQAFGQIHPPPGRCETPRDLPSWGVSTSSS